MLQFVTTLLYLPLHAFEEAAHLAVADLHTLYRSRVVNASRNPTDNCFDMALLAVTGETVKHSNGPYVALFEYSVLLG